MGLPLADDPAIIVIVTLNLTVLFGGGAYRLQSRIELEDARSIGLQHHLEIMLSCQC